MRGPSRVNDIPQSTDYTNNFESNRANNLNKEHTDNSK